MRARLASMLARERMTVIQEATPPLVMRSPRNRRQSHDFLISIVANRR